MSAATEDKRKRLYFLDNLRTFMIFLVVLYHAGIVYERGGLLASVWIVYDPGNTDFPGIFSYLFIDIFVMPVIFFISGYLIPISLGRKDSWAFIKSKFRRLMIPWVIAVLTLIPLYKVIFLYARGLPQEHWITYFHFSRENITSQNWLWFLPVLFLFNLVYLLLSKINWVPPRISLKAAVAAIFVIGYLNSLGMEILGLRGWTLTPLLDFQNERLLLYFLFFLLGSLCFQQKVFETKPESNVLYIVINATNWIPISVYIFFGLIPFMFPAGYMITPLADRLIFWLSYYLSLLTLLYLLVQTFWRYVNKSGWFWREQNRNSYTVYIIHMIVLGVIALLLVDVNIPSIVKYLTLAVSTYLASNLIISGYRIVAGWIGKSIGLGSPLPASGD